MLLILDGGGQRISLSPPIFQIILQTGFSGVIPWRRHVAFLPRSFYVLWLELIKNIITYYLPIRKEMDLLYSTVQSILGESSNFNFWHMLTNVFHAISVKGSFSNSELQLLAIQKTEIKDLVRLPFEVKKEFTPWAMGHEFPYHILLLYECIYIHMYILEYVLKFTQLRIL